MIILLEKQKKGKRYNLFVDGEFYSGISPEYIVKYNLKSGQEVEGKKLEKIVNESESYFGFNVALKYITKTQKTTKEVEDYLKKHKFNSTISENVLSRLSEYKYIDDELYVKNYIDFYKQKYGKNKIKQNLLLKKIDEELIEKYLNFDDEISLQNIKKEILKQTKNKELDLKLRQKIIRNLLSKGYNYELIKTCLNGDDNAGWD